MTLWEASICILWSLLEFRRKIQSSMTYHKHILQAWKIYYSRSFLTFSKIKISIILFCKILLQVEKWSFYKLNYLPLYIGKLLYFHAHCKPKKFLWYSIILKYHKHINLPFFSNSRIVSKKQFLIKNERYLKISLLFEISIIIQKKINSCLPLNFNLL